MRVWVPLLCLFLGVTQTFADDSNDLQKKIEVYSKHVPQDVSKSIQQLLKTDGVAQREVIERVLAQKFKNFKEAVDNYHQEKFNTASDMLSKLSGVAVVNSWTQSQRAYTLYYLSRIYIDKYEYEKAIPLLEDILIHDETVMTNVDEVIFYLAYAYSQCFSAKPEELAEFRLRSRCLLEVLTEDFKDAPKRYLDQAQWLIDEIRLEGNARPLSNLANRMDQLSKEIENSKTNKEVQEKQEQLIRDLDVVLKDAEEKEQIQREQREVWASKRRKSNDGDEDGDNPGKGKGNSSKLGNKRKHLDWDRQINEHDREAALQIMKERFPSHYRDLVEQYYRALAETPKK